PVGCSPNNLGDFSKRTSFILILRMEGSEYPTLAALGGGPGGLRPPSWPACSAPPPFDSLSGSAPRWGESPSRSYPSPTRASSRHLPTGSHSSAVPGCPSTAQWGYTCYGRAGNTAAESACQWHHKTPPCDAKMASASHCFPGRYPF